MKIPTDGRYAAVAFCDGRVVDLVLLVPTECEYQCECYSSGIFQYSNEQLIWRTVTDLGKAIMSADAHFTFHNDNDEYCQSWDSNNK